ncbi:hypothetical protein JIN85_08560 [Luteolibacter pohnpeiensis]|uniref:Uncharacterized protein n=1 Tax=Luteolibacter pohnpeiensis TaxID=454153 RepID=A0A934S768_9BACT|nr:hypothetical protein [Luteolibacter pohnpeiensis]MBK1882464.1 hypothetical protein [Luteolibacter pohnpeiensis]
MLTGRSARPDAGGMVSRGELVAGPFGSVRYRLRLQAYAGYRYEICGNSSQEVESWNQLPFSLTQMGPIDRRLHIALSEGMLDLFVAGSPGNEFFSVSFRAPGRESKIG